VPRADEAGPRSDQQRRTERVAQRVAAAKTLAFDECVRQYIEDHEAGWRNAKHRAQWKNTLAAYASPVFGKLPVAAVDGGFTTVSQIAPLRKR